MSEHNEPKRISIGMPMRFGKTASMLAKLTKAHRELYDALQGFLDVVEEPPSPNCSCHIAPPCDDCTEHAYLREVFADARRAMKNAKELL